MYDEVVSPDLFVIYSKASEGCLCDKCVCKHVYMCARADTRHYKTGTLSRAFTVHVNIKLLTLQKIQLSNNIKTSFHNLDKL